MVSSMESGFEKDYVDRGIQTESQALGASPTTILGHHIRDLSPSNSTQNISDNTQFKSPIHLEGASDFSSPNPGHSLIPLRRLYRPPQIPTPQPSGFHNSSKRVVSLPETAPYSVKFVREPNVLRVASMSERRSSYLSCMENDSSECLETFTSTDNSYLSAEDSLGHRPLSMLPDLPHTPSPPSSPESITIIGNDVQVPHSFLRHKTVSASQPSYSEDRDWMTWANSPPKPIPALHGPLSLPYARCPSGAEGTIVEGPNDLSRMIWGLDPDDPQPAHSRISLNRDPSPGITPQSKFRLWNPRGQSPQYFASQAKRYLSNAYARPPSLTLDYDLASGAALHQHTLETLGSRCPHDTYNGAVAHDKVLPSDGPKATDPWNLVYDTKAPTPSTLIDDLYMFHMDGGLGLDWQATLAHKEFNQKAKVIDHLQPSVLVSVPVGQTASSSYPRIFVESHPIIQSHNPHSMPALEVGHQIRQKQQLQTTLPTPPSSSSSQWASRFTPYAEHLCSSNPPALHQRSVNAQQQLLRQLQRHHPFLNSPQELRKPPYQSLADLSQNINSSTMSHSSAAQIARPQHTPRRSPDASPPLSRLLQDHSPNILNSPSHPGPPPNTPLPPIPIHRNIKSRARASLVIAPPSPTSPDTRIRNLSHQQPRSIPLARLIQRRLKSVPEENITSVRQVHSSSICPSGRSNPRPSSPTALSTTLEPQQDSRMPSLLGVAFVPQSRIPLPPGLDGSLQADYGSPTLPVSGTRKTVTVKLPSMRTSYVDMQQGRVVTGKENSSKHGRRKSDDTLRALPKKKVRGRKTRNANGIMDEPLTPFKTDAVLD